MYQSRAKLKGSLQIIANIFVEASRPRGRFGRHICKCRNDEAMPYERYRIPEFLPRERSDNRSSGALFTDKKYTTLLQIGHSCVTLGHGKPALTTPADGSRWKMQSSIHLGFSTSPVGQDQERGRSSGVEHDLAKVGVEGSNPFARSNFFPL